MRCIHLILVVFTGLTATVMVTADNHSTPVRSGEAVFTANCANCHTGGIGGFFSGGPDVDDPKDWEALTPKGLDALTTNTITGVGDMAARGNCTTCTDEDIRSAVEYILEKSQQ